MSKFARRCVLSLPDFIRLVRGETTGDPRPNKHLTAIQPSPVSSIKGRISLWNKVVNSGVLPAWSPAKPTVQVSRPPNHKSALDHADAVHMFAFRFDGYVVLDKSCGFGWCGSPAFYALAGSIINEMYSTSRPLTTAPLDKSCFTGNVWCDDHTCVEIDTGRRCHDANIALRRAMLSVLGPSAINEQKFTEWSTTGKALGLLWDTTAGTVSIPRAKLDKAVLLIDNIVSTQSATKTELDSLLGVLRHVVVCFPPARAFYQHIQSFASSFRTGRRRPPAAVYQDLGLFRHVLSNPDRFNGIGLNHFIRSLEPTIHVYMDASDTGLCVLEPTRREYIRCQFDPRELAAIKDEERAYSINV